MSQVRLEELATARTEVGCGRLAAVLTAAFALVALAVWILPAVPQPLEYHRFADARALLGLPNALDVLSSAAFVVVGALGLLVLRRRTGAAVGPSRPAWRVLFSGVVATGLGSAWYHLDPTNDRLVWDRLPMAVSFMALVSALVAERVGAELGRRLLVPLVLAGIASVAYWYLGERRGEGNLVPYAIVQFGSLAAIPLVLLVRRGRDGADWMIALGLYALSKAFEVSDSAVLDAVGVSGHTLKHLFAAAGIGWFARMLWRRRG